MAKLRLGVMAPLEVGPEATVREVRDFGLPTCQVSCWQPDLLTIEMADRLAVASRDDGVEVTTIWVGMAGPHVWDFVQGPLLIGLVPLKTQQERIATLKRGADFAVRAGVPSITTHAGFIPENLTNPLYPKLLDALREVVEYCGERGIDFWMETGQETPVVMLRVFEDLGYDDMGTNLDPANLLMYGKANALDALDILGAYVRGVHAKDGEYPTGGRELGVEKPLGEGRVNFPAFVGKLKELEYTGALTIEREITGPQQIKDIRQAIQYLSDLV